MTSAGGSGDGFSFTVSFAPTDRTRYLGRLGFYNQIWGDLQRCVTFPSDLTGAELDSMYVQMQCHVALGFGHLGGSTFDFEAWHPDASLTDNYTHSCNVPMPQQSVYQQFDEAIVHWAGDPSSQKAAWLIYSPDGVNMVREWIPTSAVYSCLKSQGYSGPVELAGEFMNIYMPESNTEASCSTSAPPGTQPPPVTQPPAPQTWGFAIDDYFYGGTWARTDPNDGTWYSHSVRPANGAYWYPDGLGVAVDCATAAASYTVRFADGHYETWNTWLHVTDGKWIPSAVADTIYANGLNGITQC